MEKEHKYTEEELLQALKGKSRKAFDYLYDNYSAALYGVIVYIIKDENYSSDVLQEVFVKIWNSIDSYNPAKSRFYTWMLNIARNHSIDKVRAGNSQTRKENQDYIRMQAEKGSQAPFIDGIGLRKLIETLEVEQREIIELLYFKGYTQSEVAEELNIPLGTVKSRVRLAMGKLRKYFT